MPSDAGRLAVAAGAVRSRGLQRSEHRLLLAAGDAACGAAAVLLALWAWSMTTGFAFDQTFLRRSGWWLALVPAWTILLSSSRRLPAALSMQVTARGLLRSAAVLAGLYAVAYFYAPPRALPRLPAIYFVWEAILLTLAWRTVYRFVMAAEGFRRRAVVIGSGDAAARLIAMLRTMSPDVQVVAAIQGVETSPALDVPVFVSSELDSVIARFGVSEVIVTTRSMPNELVRSLLTWQQRAVAVVPMTSEYEHLLMRVPVADLPEGWIFGSLSEWVRARDSSTAVKRLIDVVGGAIGIVALVAVLPIVAVAVWLDSGMPLFYRQTRLGVGGREFSVLKFRSMVVGAEPDGPRWAQNRDARVTRVGRWLRRSRLDELPQVVNVVRGEMSLVGPRPERPAFTEELERTIPGYRARLMVRPGLTGWAQVNTDYGASHEDAILKLEYDVYYIKHRSFLFDAWILLKTAATILSLRGR